VSSVSTSSTGPIRASSRWRRLAALDYVLLALIFAALVVRLLLSPPIWQHGEAREGLVVQAIVYNHQWILPFRNGELPSKPPLFHWIAAVFALIAGFSDLVLRLPSAIAAEIVVIATFLLGRELGGRKTAWLAAGVCLGMYDIWDAGTQARVDMVLAACLTVAFVCFFYWYRYGHQLPRAGCYIAVACAVLTKGPVGVLLAGLVIGGVLGAERKLWLLKRFWSWPLAAIAFGIDAGWYALAYRVGGDAFLNLQLFHENVDRFIGNGSFSARHSVFTLLGWLAIRTLPWNLALLPSMLHFLRRERQDAATHLLHAWWIAVVVFFACAAGKRFVYLLPAYPAIALLAARAMAAWMAGRTGSSFVGVTQPFPGAVNTAKYWTRMATRAGVAVAILDLVLMTVNTEAWTRNPNWKDRLDIIETIHAELTPESRIFATPDFPPTDLIVIAYRLGREIDRKPIICAHPNDYFLSSFGSKDLADVDSQVLASSKTLNISFVAVVSGRRMNPNQGPSGTDPSLIGNGAGRCPS
jgi:4-amino-4-deoxy-L-arabinose transferase-like glycosyltransferase